MITLTDEQKRNAVPRLTKEWWRSDLQPNGHCSWCGIKLPENMLKNIYVVSDLWYPYTTTHVFGFGFNSRVNSQGIVCADCRKELDQTIRKFIYNKKRNQAKCTIGNAIKELLHLNKQPNYTGVKQ